MTRKDKRLSTEDRILWSQVARTVDPLPGRMEDLLSENLTPAAFPADKKPIHKPKDQLATAKSENRPGPASPKSGLNPIDGSVYRKLARGRLPLEASLDLHGLTQDQAFGLLQGFLSRARQKGLRHVLVITGKGASYGSEGALRRAVPLWLRKPELRAIASGVEPAARGHGGDGALYIRLRKLER